MRQHHQRSLVPPRWDVPLAANLAQGELAINIADGKLYYENSSGVVTLLAGAGGAVVLK